MSRKSPFHNSQFGQNLGVQADQASGKGFSGDDHLQGIPTTEKAERNRRWEQANKTQSYWGIPVHIRDAVANVALEIGVKVDDIARAFFEFSLEEYRSGSLVLKSLTNPLGRGKMTLYPPASGWGQSSPWKRGTWDPRPHQVKTTRRARPKKADLPGEKTCVFTIRHLPKDLHHTLCQVADQRFIPIGEVVTAFLKYALEAYASGALVPNPIPVVGRKTLYPEAV